MEFLKPVILNQTKAPEGLTQWEKARSVITNVYESRINQERMSRHRMLEVLQFLEANDPSCHFDFENDEEKNVYNIKFNFFPALQPYVDDVLAGKEPQQITPRIKGQITRFMKKLVKENTARVENAKKENNTSEILPIGNNNDAGN